MPSREVQWERMFPDELEAAFAACPVVYLPYGLCEPHGWHNAVGGGIWLAPLDPLNAVTIVLARSGERHGVYARTGFMF